MEEINFQKEGYYFCKLESGQNDIFFFSDEDDFEETKEFGKVVPYVFLGASIEEFFGMFKIKAR